MAQDESTNTAPRRLIAGSRVAGTAVFNLAGERLGTIDDVMIDKQSGRIAYALLSFGGFLGVGTRQHPLPWSALRYDLTLEGYVVDLDRDRLEGAPILTEAASEWEDVSWAQRVHDYYQVLPSWTVLP